MPEIVLGGRTISYRRRISARAKRVIVRVEYRSGVELVVPHRGAPHRPEAVLERYADWVLRQIDRVERLKAHSPHIEWRHGGSVPLFGRPCPIEVQPTALNRAAARYEAGVIRVTLPRDAGEDLLRRLILALFVRIGQEVVGARVPHHAALAGVQPGRIRFRMQRSLWGSCTARGDLAFNLRLLLAPPEILDYVVAHEVAHLLHLDHGPAFKALLGRLCPDYRRHERWLHDNGESLGF